MASRKGGFETYFAKLHRQRRRAERRQELARHAVRSEAQDSNLTSEELTWLAYRMGWVPRPTGWPL